MNTPPFLIAAALLFWGWQTDFLIFGAIMGAAVESSRFVKSRLHFSDTDLNRIWDLCGLLFAGAFALVYSSQEIRLPAFVFPQWLPFVFLPMMLAQSYGTADSIGLKTYSWFLRWRKAESEWSSRRVNFSYLYLAICILGASTTNKFGANLNDKQFNWYYLCLAIVLGWALFSVRPRRLPLPYWLSLLLIVFGGGFVAHRTLQHAQASIETAVGSWIIRFWGRRQIDPSESRTAIGRIGRLKLSGKIILRVEPSDGKSAPDLLRETTFVGYRNETWYAGRSQYNPVVSENDSWTLVQKKADLGATIHAYLNNRATILPLPVGTSKITNLPAVLKINELGTVKAEEGPGLMSYFVNYGPGPSADGAPTDRDRDVNDSERPALEKIAQELRFDSPELAQNDDKKLQAISRFFANNFTYSTFISQQHVDPTGMRTPLAVFLEDTHSGHCEYFATATVLLARRAGIPARYATGYSVQETAGTKSYVVRERHAHAWAMVWRNGTWENFDTTPASWDAMERQNASFFQPLSDLWSRIVFEFSKWRYGKTSYQTYLVWALVPLILILIWRIVRNKERKRLHDNGKATSLVVWPGADSEFYAVQRKLIELGFSRSPEEPAAVWCHRIAATYPSLQEVATISALHTRYRFDPDGISIENRQRLSSLVSDILRKIQPLIDSRAEGQTVPNSPVDKSKVSVTVSGSKLN